MTASPIRWAMQCGRPACIPHARPKAGAKAEGLRYERQLQRALPAGIAGQWFWIEDLQGRRRYCQADHIIRLGEALVVLEAKLCWTLEGHKQLEQLYLPALQFLAGGRQVLGIVVARRIPGQIPVAIAGSLEEAARVAEGGRRVCWHWLGPKAGVGTRIAA